MGIDLIIDENMHGHAEKSEKLVPVHLEHCYFEESGAIFSPHWHEQLILIYLKKGTLILKCGEQKLIVEKNSIAVVNPNEIHSGENPESALEYYLMKIDLLLLLGNQPDLQQTMYTELLLKNHVVFENKISNDYSLLENMKNIINEFHQKDEGYELVIKGLSFLVLTTLLRKYTKTVQNQLELDLQYRRLKQIKPAITYMENNMCEKITLKQLAEVTSLSTSHFTRIFKTVSRLSPMDYLNQMRVQKAAHLLLKTDKTIMEIAMDIGFNDSNYFSRFFKKCRNVTPSEFRKKYVREADR